MSVPILTTKPYIPPQRHQNASRPRLIDLINQNQHGVILVSAPAGFANTAIVSQWIEKIATPSAWLSLDEGDET